MRTEKFVVKVIPVSLDKETLEIEKYFISNGYNFASVMRIALKTYYEKLPK